MIIALLCRAETAEMTEKSVLNSAQGQETLSLSRTPYFICGPRSLLLFGYRELFSPAVQQHVSDADSSTLFSSIIRNH